MLDRGDTVLANRPITGDSHVQFRRARRIGRVLAASLGGVLVWKWVLVQIVFRNAPWSLVGAVTILFLGLLIASIVGLLRMRPWGFYCAYVLVPVSTVLHGIALIPFIPELLPSQTLRIGSVLVLNVGFLVATVVAHLMSRRSEHGVGSAKLSVPS